MRTRATSGIIDPLTRRSTRIELQRQWCGSNHAAGQRLINDRDRAASRPTQDAATPDTLSNRILSSTSVSAVEIAWMSQKQRFTQDPRLALAYYYCCGVNPDSFVFGDEQVRGTAGASTRQRLLHLFDDFPKVHDLEMCQKAATATSSEQTDVWACVSCGRILLDHADNTVHFRRLDDMRDDFLLSSGEKEKLMSGVSEAFVRQYRQVFVDGEDFYYLIPELLRDRNKIPLCVKCNAGPRSSNFSVASGHDYGRIDQLPALSDVGAACITPTRSFGLELSLSGSSGHAIAFPSNGPCELARVLPSVDRDCMPPVTFVGPLEDWRIQRKKFRSLYAIDVNAVYKWLHELTKVNSVFLDENVVVDETAARQQQLREMEDAIESTVHVSQSKAVTTVQNEAAFDDAGGEAETRNSDVVVVRNSVVVQISSDSHGRTLPEIFDALMNVVDGNPSVN